MVFPACELAEQGFRITADEFQLRAGSLYDVTARINLNQIADLIVYAPEIISSFYPDGLPVDYILGIATRSALYLCRETGLLLYVISQTSQFQNELKHCFI